jgi:lipoprotein signal peptidase
MKRVGDVQTAVFNVAEVFVLVGAAMLIHGLAKEGRDHDDDTNGNETA